MAKFVLHCFAQSGNAYKPALMLELAGADWEPRFVDFFNGGVRTPEYRELNEMGEVPVLEHKKRRITQSGVILHYLADKLDRYGANGKAEEREILRWILWDNHKLTGSIATLRFLRQFAKTGETPVTAFLEGRARAALKVLDGHMAGRDWVAADRLTIADLSLCGYLYYGDELGFDLAEYENVTPWLARLKAEAGWKHPYDLMPGHPLPEKT